jgi:hypothetical protein
MEKTFKTRHKHIFHHTSSSILSSLWKTPLYGGEDVHEKRKLLPESLDREFWLWV